MPAAVSPVALFATPFFRSLVSEWRLHVENGQDPAVFANLFLELMRDPQDAQIRQACTMFMNYARARNWTTVRADLAPFVDAEAGAAFARPNAEAFYEGFRTMVVEAIRDYWEQFMAVQKGSNGLLGPKDWSPRAKGCRARGNICGDRFHRKCGLRRAD